MPMPVTVKKWGSSMAVLIPSQFAKLQNIGVGTVLDLQAVKVIKPRRRYKLAELVAQYKPQHRQGEWHLGGAVGKEIWWQILRLFPDAMTVSITSCSCLSRH